MRADAMAGDAPPLDRFLGRRFGYHRETLAAERGQQESGESDREGNLPLGFMHDVPPDSLEWLRYLEFVYLMCCTVKP